MNEGMDIAVWFGIGGLALIWGNVQLWHTRRVLKRLRPEAAVPVTRLLPAAAAAKPIISGIAS